MRPRSLFVPGLVLLLHAAACGGTQPNADLDQEDPAMAFSLTSPAFEAGGSIPARHTCDDRDLSPELSWTEPPAGTRSLALISDDPDAPVGNWVHWVLYDLGPDARSLPEGLPTDGELQEPVAATQGTNDFGRPGYGGPCPPPGAPHRYFFRLYALDARLELGPGATKKDVEQAMQGHVLGQTELMGRYARQR